VDGDRFDGGVYGILLCRREDAQVGSDVEEDGVDSWGREKMSRGHYKVIRQSEVPAAVKRLANDIRLARINLRKEWRLQQESGTHNNK
jgi:hypothetical protein